MELCERLVRCFGENHDFDCNPLMVCPACGACHDEPRLVLGVLTGWGCQKIGAYHSRVMLGAVYRVRTGAFRLGYNYMLRKAPHMRDSLHQETDAAYLARLVELSKNRPLDLYFEALLPDFDSE